MRSSVTGNSLKLMGKVPVNKERFTMVVTIGKIVAETCLGGR